MRLVGAHLSINFPRLFIWILQQTSPTNLFCLKACLFSVKIPLEDPLDSQQGSDSLMRVIWCLESQQQIIKPKENHKSNIDEENGNWNIEREEVQNDNERQKYDTGIKSPLYDKNIGSIHENDERFSPEKENALQTLDAVIQEVEDSLGTKPLYFIYTQHI